MGIKTGLASMTSSISPQSVGDTKVLGGNYDSKSNLLILDVSISQGLNQAPLLQKRIFEIHSVTVQAPNQPSVELVSARVKESAAAVFDAFIEQLKQGDSSFTKELFAKAVPSATNQMPFVKKVTMGLQANGRSLSGNMNVENSQLSLNNETKSFLRETVSKVNQVVQPQSIQKMFQLPQLGQWFQGAQSPQKTHQWDHSFSVALTPSDQSDQILKFLHQNFKKLRERTFQLESKLQSLEPQIAAMHALKAKIEQLLREMNITGESEDLLRDNLQQLRKSFAFFTALESKIASNQALVKELADFLLVRNLYEHKISNPGVALVGAQLTQDWETFIHKYHLIASDQNAIEEHLNQSLALTVTDEILDETVNIQDLEEACELLEEGADNISFVSAQSSSTPDDNNFE